MKVVLLKDIIIPAGTIFSDAPSKTERFGEGHVEALFAVSNDTCGNIVYDLSELKTDPQLKSYFAEVNQPDETGAYARFTQNIV